MQPSTHSPLGSTWCPRPGSPWLRREPQGPAPGASLKQSRRQTAGEGLCPQVMAPQSLESRTVQQMQRLGQERHQAPSGPNCPYTQCRGPAWTPSISCQRKEPRKWVVSVWQPVSPQSPQRSKTDQICEVSTHQGSGDRKGEQRWAEGLCGCVMYVSILSMNHA